MMTALTLCFALMMSVPYLIPHMGWLSLFGLVPLLCMERIGTICGIRRLWRWHYAGFVLWNAFTTFWVCNATVGGGIFAILANSLQMSLVFGAFRLSRKVFRGTLPYIFFAALWIAWEKAYFSAQISWPWLTLGNSFARTLSLAQCRTYRRSRIRLASNNLELDNLGNFLCHDIYTSLKWIQHLEIVDEFPKTISGKIKRTTLREESK